MLLSEVPWDKLKIGDKVTSKDTRGVIFSLDVFGKRKIISIMWEGHHQTNLAQELYRGTEWKGPWYESKQK